jgi:hypothetical protein
MNHIGFRLLLFLTILCTVAKANSLTYSLTSYSTLVQLVTYNFNYTFTSVTISASATPIITFSLNYIITEGSLSNCQYILTTSATSWALAACSVTTNSSANNITFTGIYGTSMTAQTFLGLQVSLI